ncbi:MAG: DHH family phosphoesterase [Bacteroidales bacterium]|nr:DHH family phosphoesterase [Bacteroidales bacterium]
MNFSKEDISRLESVMKATLRPVIISHLNPDGDALGSSVGLAGVLRSLGASPSIVFPTEYADNLSFILPEGIPVHIHSEDPEGAEKAIAAADAIFCLDFNGLSRIEKVGPAVAARDCVKVLIDHHLAPETGSFDIVFSETEISSASELLFCILMNTSFAEDYASRLPSESAVALLPGMTTDTNNFANSVFPMTLEMAARLIEAGVDREYVLEHIYHSYREERYRLLGYLLSEKLTITSDGVAYMILSGDERKKFDVREGETEAFVNIPLEMEKVRMSIFIKEMDDRYRVSIRSKKGVSAQKCSRMYFNGGGHENAAGGRLSRPGDFASAEEVASYVERVTKEFFNGNE